ncbi:MAG: hypothetical protein UX89_C0002G0059 [Parcubacteria group bacterium GW2011_GWA2_47_16]|nr:MAG: hypothetical protein UX89_C0002G0059 [Parcubacteria group bacterium GW2011_GWA2_47_16]
MTIIHVIRLALIVAVLMAFLHGAATIFFLYSFYWWFDIPLHFLGGFCAGLISLYFYSHFRRGNVIGRIVPGVLLAAILGTIVVGLGWEVFEYSAGITFNTVGNHALDTVKDLVMDILGGYAAYLYFIAQKFHKVRN